jgi:hypothetical protein
MKTYLTATEFADLLFNTYKRRMATNHSAELSDRILWSMFQHYEKDVKETLEGSMWQIDTYDGENAIDLIGYDFHKTFRQVDVIPAKHIDGIVWSCMQEAPIFWKCLEKVCKILTNEDAAKIYVDAMEFE